MILYYTNKYLSAHNVFVWAGALLQSFLSTNIVDFSHSIRFSRADIDDIWGYIIPFWIVYEWKTNVEKVFKIDREPCVSAWIERE